MGGYLSCHAPLDYESCQLGPSRVSWTVPTSEADGEKGAPSTVAGRAYAVGEVLERAPCLLLGPDQLHGSYIEPYLYPLADGSGRKLFQFGWGLLYGRCPWEAGANLVAEYLPETFGAAAAPEVRHWLVFRVRRPISKGEPLLVANPSTLPHIFTAAAVRFGDACYTNDCPSRLKEEASDDREIDGLEESFMDRLTVTRLKDNPPEQLQLLEEAAAPVLVRASPIHGLGCFAARDIAKGEVVELAPSLPLESGGQMDSGILDGYTFDYTACCEMLQLGNASLYNHSDAPNMSHIKFRATPFLEAWVADMDIEEGQELFHDYGRPYFESRDMIMKGDSEEGGLRAFAHSFC